MRIPLMSRALKFGSATPISEHGRWSKIRSQTEIDQFDSQLVRRGANDILWLNIAVNDALFVQMFDS